MPAGSCLCGNLRYSYDEDSSEQPTTILCHCADCKKISGSAFSTNFLVDGSSFKFTGKPKTYSKMADSGKEITSFFCPDCGSTLWRESASFGTSKAVKVGTLDEPLPSTAGGPKIELYAPGRLDWVPAAPGSLQKEAMP